MYNSLYMCNSLYMYPATTTRVRSSDTYMCRATTYESYILLCVSSYYRVSVLTLLYICVLILVYRCTQTRCFLICRIRMLTYADVCWRMLTFADVCWRMLTYADMSWYYYIGVRRRGAPRSSESLARSRTCQKGTLVLLLINSIINQTIN